MMWGVFSEMERDIISNRVKSGMANAREKGSRIGRPEITIDTIPASFWKLYHRYSNKQLSISEMAKIAGCSRATIYKYIRIIENSEKQE